MQGEGTSMARLNVTAIFMSANMITAFPFSTVAATGYLTQVNTRFI